MAEQMVLGLMVGAKVDEYVERTDPGEFRVLEEGGEVVSLLRLDRQAQWWLGRALPSAQVLQLATPPQHRGAGHGARLLHVEDRYGDEQRGGRQRGREGCSDHDSGDARNRARRAHGGSLGCCCVAGCG